MALLARDVDLDNPNYDWWPTHIWSNDRAASFVFGEPGWRKQYHERARELGVRRALSDPAVDIFAFHEMNRDSGTPQNDKPIFASVTSLMKAQSYELEALPQRKTTLLVYQFNLLTVVDADLVRIHFDDIGVRSSPVVEEQYIASYIIKKRHTIARIHFVNSAEFPAVVKDYGRLHKANITIFREASKFFYEDLLTDSNRVVLFADDFKQAVSLDLTSRLRRHASNHRVLDSVCVAWNELERRADVYVAAYDDDLKFLTEDKKARQIVAKALKDIYRFDGPFEFVEDIPF